MDFRQIINANNMSPSDEDDFRLFESRRAPGLANWILRIKHGDPGFKRLELTNFDDRLGWDATAWRRLGHLLGQNEHLEELVVWGSVVDAPGLLAGLCDNRHIRSLRLVGVDIQAAEHWNLLVLFLSRNPSLRVVNLYCCLGQDSINILSNSILCHSLDTLQELNLDGNHFRDIDLGELVQALSRSKTKILRLENNGIGRKGCASLARLLEIRCSSLKRVHLDDNPIDDESAIMLAESLAKNTKLELLGLSGDNKIGRAGWLAILKRVCNTPSVGDVVDSNHTLQSLGCFSPDKVKSLNRALGVDDANLLRASLKLNRAANKMPVARRKIIWSHVLGRLNVGDSSIVASVVPRILAWIGSGSDETGANLVDFRDPPLPGAELDAVRLGAIFRIVRTRPDMMFGGNKSVANDPTKTLSGQLKSLSVQRIGNCMRFFTLDTIKQMVPLVVSSIKKAARKRKISEITTDHDGR